MQRVRDSLKHDREAFKGLIQIDPLIGLKTRSWGIKYQFIHATFRIRVKYNAPYISLRSTILLHCCNKPNLMKRRRIAFDLLASMAHFPNRCIEIVPSPIVSTFYTASRHAWDSGLSISRREKKIK